MAATIKDKRGLDVHGSMFDKFRAIFGFFRTDGVLVLSGGRAWAWGRGVLAVWE